MRPPLSPPPTVRILFSDHYGHNFTAPHSALLDFEHRIDAVQDSSAEDLLAFQVQGGYEKNIFYRVRDTEKSMQHFWVWLYCS